MFSDVLDILREEVRSLAAAGCRYIQVDAPEAATLVDPEVRAWFAGNGVEPERFLTEGMDLVNELPRAVSEDVYWGVHLCRGNNQGGWMGTGGYEQIAEPVFSRVSNYDAVLLEYDDQRSGGFEPLSHLPDDIVAVLGLISSKQARIESAGDIRRRVEEAGRVRPHDTLALSTQCGFASIVFGNPIDEETQEAKLRLVAELAHELW
jgi:5-methyltetrahydropteroyltriglutamate--homocysteine methyltransferase